MQFLDATDIENKLRLEEALLHRRDKICAAGEDMYLPGMGRKLLDGFSNGARTQQFESGKTQSSPPDSVSASAALVRRAGSWGCRSGPRPLWQSAPPCSRKCAGAVGSTWLVKSIFLLLDCFARSAARTRSGVNGASRSRIPTAS